MSVQFGQTCSHAVFNSEKERVPVISVHLVPAATHRRGHRPLAALRLLLAPQLDRPGAHMLWRTLPCPCFVRLAFNNRPDNTCPPPWKLCRPRDHVCAILTARVSELAHLPPPMLVTAFPNHKVVTSATHNLLPASNQWTLAEHGAARSQPPSFLFNQGTAQQPQRRNLQRLSAPQKHTSTHKLQLFSPRKHLETR